ncbi:MAG: hypothetical protein LC104_22065 [Bacteroidales bacterium]|nr:hypothetical protein [Bacteroidales bacterium]
MCRCRWFAGLRTGLWAFTLALLGPESSRAQTPPAELMKYIPQIVNTVGVVNVQSILKTPRAQREGWATRHHTEYLAGAIPINPSIERLLLATEFVPNNPGHGGGFAIAPLDEPFDADKMAKIRGGKVVEVAGQKVVMCPTGVCFAPLKNNLLGATRTTSTQDLSRWVHYAETADRSLQSRYLMQAINATGTSTQILLAVDTEDLFTRDQAQGIAAANQSLQNDQDALNGISLFVGGLRGVRFTADVADQGLRATIRLDSRVAPRFPPEAFKAFFIEVLEQNGAMLDDMLAAQVRTDQNSVIFTLQVSDGELARIMSLVLPPATGISESSVIRIAPDGVSLEPTRRYFLRVNRIVDDLRRQYAGGTRSSSYPRTALWHRTAANQIHALSILGVDRAVADYGLGTADRLNEIANSLQGVPARVKELESKMYYLTPRQSFFRMGYFPAVALPWGNNIGEIRGKQQQVIEGDKAMRDQLWSQIDEQRATVRREMATKYKSDIGVPARN